MQSDFITAQDRLHPPRHWRWSPLESALFPLAHGIPGRVRGMLARLEEIGAVEAIKIVKSVDWDVLDKWTDERLIEVGTERGKKERFAYEIFDGGRTS